MTLSRWRFAPPLIALALAALFAVSCNQQPDPTPTSAATPLPAVALLPTGGSAKASGEVVPAQKADLAFSTTGRVQSIAASIGEEVAGGALLIRLDDAVAAAAVTQGRAALFRAQAQLAELKAGTRPEQIAAAQGRLDAAQARLDQITTGARPEQVNAAKADLAAAQSALQQLFNGPREQERIELLAGLANAQAALKQAQSAYDQVASASDVGMLPQSQQLQQATNNYEAAKARYDALFAGPDADLAAAARARVQQMQAALDLLLNPATPSQVAEAQAQVRSAQAELDLLKAGPGAEALAIAAVAVTEAEAALQRAEAAASDTMLTAPFAGTVTALTVNLGEMVTPGKVVLTVANLASLQVETTDLSERDVGSVAVGQSASVFVTPLNTEVSGRVVRISPQATVIGGDVVYAVVVALDSQPPELRWGMSVEVEIPGK